MLLHPKRSANVNVAPSLLFIFILKSKGIRRVVEMHVAFSQVNSLNVPLVSYSSALEMKTHAQPYLCLGVIIMITFSSQHS